MSDDSFIDLRLNRQEGQIAESFWPSFTDIMTVVVMIFMIAMVVLLLRNIELVNQLRATMEAERVAAELARATGAEKDSLAMQLHTAEDRLAALQLRALRLEEQRAQQEQLIAQQDSRISDLSSARDELQRRAQVLTQSEQRLQSDLASSRGSLSDAQQRIAALAATLDRLEQNIGDLKQQVESSQSQISGLQQDLVTERQSSAELRRQRQQADRKYLVLVGEYDDLKIKYDKLIRPARSPQGRYVVEVRYWKDEGGYRIAYREGSETPFQPSSREALESKLAGLNEKHPNGLFVRVIFPENSGLSYNEAWSFTSAIHRAYDYYFREQPETEPEPAAAPKTGTR